MLLLSLNKIIYKLNKTIYNRMCRLTITTIWAKD